MGEDYAFGLKMPCAPKGFDARVSDTQTDETLESKLARVPEQSKFTHCAYLIAAGLCIYINKYEGTHLHTYI